MAHADTLNRKLTALRNKSASMLKEGFADENQRREWYRVEDEILSLERDVAATLNVEYAASLEWCVKWTRSSSFITYFDHNFQAYLAYDCIFGMSRADANELALVELPYCYSLRTGGANDEVHEGHPLFGKGLTTCSAFEIINSSWLASERQINAVHPQFRSEFWDQLSHYMWVFHDGIVEAIAKSVSVRVVTGSLETVMWNSGK